MPNDIEVARNKLFTQLAGGETRELSARYLKGDFEAPRATARLIDGKVRLLVTDSQLRDTEDRLRLGDGTRPNLTTTFQRWLRDETKSLRSIRDEEDRGSWVSATAAANMYRWLYSARDYPSGGTDSARRKQGTAIRGWDEWAFSVDDSTTGHLLRVNTGDLPTVDAWLANPVGEPPLPRGSAENHTPHDGATTTFELLPGEKARLLAALRDPDLPSAERIRQWLAAFQERFPLSRLERLSGSELLEEMHGRRSGDCMMYWLEFKKDETFDTGAFGSIRGGNALKFVVYQAAEDGLWRTGTTRELVVIPAAQAAHVAEKQRDQLLAAVELVNTLPDDPSSHAYATLQATIEAAAPDFHQLAFFHKALCLYCPGKLDDYHSWAVQDHALTAMGLIPPAPGQRKLYTAAHFFVTATRELGHALGSAVPMNHLTAALNHLHGQPVGHWRIGTGENGEHWEAMRDREFVAIGWEKLGDLSDIVGGFSGKDGIDALKVAIQARWPDHHHTLVGREARQVWSFYNTMKEGDRVYAAHGQTILGVGEFVGPYYFEADDMPYTSRRRVKWLWTTPFRAPSKTGLLTTVHSFARAFDILTEAAREMDAREAVPAPERKPKRLAKALAPAAAQLERKGQVILYGPPGTGKTYLALQVAEELVARSKHGQGWGDLSPEARATLKGAAGADEQRIWTCTFHPAYGYEDFVEGLKARPTQGGLEFRPEPGLFKRICELAERNRTETFVLIIDEFNRGDSPRIFGELLTLLELDKRERVFVQLPYSGERFTVPRNVRLLATMNTADRSISLLDAALRRRFGFVEYPPDATVLGDATVHGLRLGELLRVVNERLLAALGDAARNLQVGHAYLMSEAQPITSVIALRSAIRYDLLPLLQEYCAEDPGALHALLGDAFYDSSAQRFRDDLMETGREADFIEALVSWDRDRLAGDDEPSDPELDEDTLDEEDPD